MIRVRDRARLDAHHERAVEGLQKDAILSAEGVEALDRILAGPLPERVVVSPVPLAALLASVRTPPGAPEGGGRARPPSGRDLRPVTEALLAHEAVADVAAADRQDQAGERRLVAWVAFKAGEQATASELRRHLKERVPEDLVAQAFVEVDAIPRKGGEPDWPALVSPFGEAEAAVGPRNPTEQAIAEIWCELLGVPAVSVRDNFFDIGGHSLLSVRFVARLHRKLQVRLLHEHVVVHTLEQLAAMCDSMARAKVS